MCGIVGYISKEKDKTTTIKKMADKIIHRGPDAEGYYTDAEIALGHRRLSIIDLSSGDQPMYNEDKSLVVVFNGEIYNYLELKKELVGEHSFKTTSDTEVLLHGYEKWGKDLTKKLRGMFAFAIYDIKNKELFMARDPFGIKPLYYCSFNDTFMFASEIKSFLEHSDFKKELNKELIGPYLSFSFTPTTETFFKGVYRLNPGCMIKVKNNKIDIEEYFNLEFNEEKISYDETVDKIADVMKDSVEHHLLSDVEVGSFLSSGVDSSYLVALAKPDKTYTVGYDIPKYDEISYAKDLTDKLNLKNTSKVINKQEYMEAIPKIMYHMDEPSADPAAVALYFVAELAGKDLKVVLSGEGADEFFGGYNTYRQEVDWSLYNKIPFIIRKGLSKIAGLFPEVRGFNFVIRRGQTIDESYIGINKIFSEKESNKTLKTKRTISNQDVTRELMKKYQNESDLVKMQVVDINYWLIKDILQKADRMTMAHSLEGRVPFIDLKVFDVAGSIPIEYKVTKENTKVALRSAAEKVIPNDAYKKKKLGFPVPIREWMRDTDVYEEIKTTFNSNAAKELFDYKYILKLLEEHKANKKDNYRKVWCVYCFLKWHNVYFG